MTYQEENNLLLKNYLDRTFFNAWRNRDNEENNPIFYGNYKQLELNLNGSCDLDCTYCYIKKHQHEFYPRGTKSKSKILENTDILLEWLYKNNLKPDLEIFSGDPLVQNLGHDVIELIIEKAEKYGPLSNHLSVPTNMGVLLHPERRARLEANMERAKKAGVHIGLSASVDGPFMEDNRPFERKNKFKRDDNFYHELFTWAKKYGLGFHPMVYSNNIHKWKDNFLWFQEMFKKYDLPWWNIYLLEVRNVEWTEDQCKGLYDFMRWLVGWTIDMVGGNLEAYGVGKFFNILGSPFSTTGRGIGCSIQSSLQVRMGDLTWGLCHRLMYDKYNNGQFKVENGEIVDIEAMNIEPFLAMNSVDRRNFTNCESCAIKEFCSAGCLGSNYETTGDIFTNAPTVCRMEHYKIMGLIHGLQDKNALHFVAARLSEEKKQALQILIEQNLV